MKKKVNGVKAPGAEAPVTLQDVKTWLKKDIAVAVSCLNAIHTDPDLQEHIASFMFGRLQNAQQKKAMESQPNLFDKAQAEKLTPGE